MKKRCSIADCIWSEQASFCSMLDSANVPLDAKWPLVILFLRGVKDAAFLSETQKAQMQDLLLLVLQERSFTASRYEEVQQKIYSIITVNLSEKLKAIVKETSELSRDMQQMFSKHRDAVTGVTTQIDNDFDKGVDPARLLAKLRTDLRNIAAKMTEDAEVLKHLSQRDALTGLANRRKFDDFLEAGVEAWKESGTPISLIMLDVDHFKQFNDTYGHLVGDQVLCTMAKRLSEVIEAGLDTKNKGLVARYGGEEFVIILQGPLAARSGALAEQIRKTIQNSALTIRDNDNKIVQRGVRVTISIGICTLQDSWTNSFNENLVDFADKALYYAKDNGRNCTAAYAPEKNPPYDLLREA
ncbi:GGDEF domain-containing protein [Desulfovibrio sp. OttesenSCG-928-G15]|nr:GGDEF domain-containing protein [Desulfovibrio sp. OttesenSCG-928-G15]